MTIDFPFALGEMVYIALPYYDYDGILRSVPHLGKIEKITLFMFDGKLQIEYLVDGWNRIEVFKTKEEVLAYIELLKGKAL